MLRAPASLNELEIERHRGRDPDTGALLPDDVIDSLGSAVAAARLACEQIVALSAAATGDRSMSVEGHQVRLRRAALAAGEHHARTIDAARRSAADVIARIDSETGSPAAARDAGAISIAAEVRSTLSRMPVEARAKAIDAALAGTDDVILGAILAGPALLSGLAEIEHQNVRLRFRHSRFRLKAMRMARLQRALDATVLAGSLLVKFVGEAASPVASRDADRAAAAVTEALEALQLERSGE